MKDDVFDAVIVAGGEFPTTKQPLKILQDTSFVVCCDGAADRYIATGRIPDAIVGDGDSISAENREKFAHIL
ncbi:MAG: thiamine diphosphokinase, partial [Bacteroidaceae bacterium]|nr:thiamine diphosphokinase [Bacteroidaceae bacterium]